MLCTISAAAASTASEGNVRLDSASSDPADTGQIELHLPRLAGSIIAVDVLHGSQDHQVGRRKALNRLVANQAHSSQVDFFQQGRRILPFQDDRPRLVFQPLRKAGLQLDTEIVAAIGAAAIGKAGNAHCQAMDSLGFGPDSRQDVLANDAETNVKSPAAANCCSSFNCPVATSTNRNETSLPDSTT